MAPSISDFASDDELLKKDETRTKSVESKPTKNTKKVMVLLACFVLLIVFLVCVIPPHDNGTIPTPPTPI